jgi:hypothetical protein
MNFKIQTANTFGGEEKVISPHEGHLIIHIYDAKTMVLILMILFFFIWGVRIASNVLFRKSTYTKDGVYSLERKQK